MKIIDICLFSGEMDILDIRLEIMYPYIDHFIIIESKKTFRNNDKKLYFDMNRYKKYLDKILYLIIDEFPNFNEIYQSENWSRRCYQTNYMINGLNKLDLDDNDLIIFTDCDEIINEKTLHDLIKTNGKCVINNKNNILKFVLDLHYYNIFTRGDKWYGALITTNKKMREMINTRLGMVEDQRRNHGYDKIKDAGWHLSYWGSVDDILFKMSKLADVVSNNRNNILKLRESSKDVLGRGDNNGAGPHNLKKINPKYNDFENIIIYKQYNINDLFSKIAYKLKCDNLLKYRITEYYDILFNDIRLNKLNIYCNHNISLFKKYFSFSKFNSSEEYDLVFSKNIDILKNINSSKYIIESSELLNIELEYKTEIYINNKCPILNDDDTFFNYIIDNKINKYYLYIINK